MSDHPEETGLDGITHTPLPDDLPDLTPAPASNGAGVIGANPDDLDIFDLDEFMSNAKGVIRTAHLCMDGTLEDQYRLTVQELASLVDDDGDPVSGEEASLAEKSHVEELNAKAHDLHLRIRANSRAIVFEAMPVDKYEALEDQHLTRGKNYNLPRFQLEIIAQCATSPTFTVTQVAKLRTKLSKAQFLELSNTAYLVNTEGGTSVPKSPHYLRTPEREQSLSN